MSDILSIGCIVHTPPRELLLFITPTQLRAIADHMDERRKTLAVGESYTGAELCDENGEYVIKLSDNSDS